MATGDAMLVHASSRSLYARAALTEIMRTMSFALCEDIVLEVPLLGKKWGLDRTPKKPPLFYILLGVGMIGGTVLAVADADPIGLLVLSAIVNGIAAGPFLVILMLISRDRRIMGEHRNGRLAATLGWFTTGLMCIAGAYGVWYTISGGWRRPPCPSGRASAHRRGRLLTGAGVRGRSE